MWISSLCEPANLGCGEIIAVKSQRPPAKPEAGGRWSGPRPHGPSGVNRHADLNPRLQTSSLSPREAGREPERGVRKRPRAASPRPSPPLRRGEGDHRSSSWDRIQTVYSRNRQTSVVLRQSQRISWGFNFRAACHWGIYIPNTFSESHARFCKEPRHLKRNISSIVANAPEVISLCKNLRHQREQNGF